MAEFYAAEDAGLVQNMADGTWVLNQTVMALDGSGGGWILDVTYGAAMDWDAWLDYESPSGNTNTSYKLDCGTDLVDNHEDWEYRIMESGTLTGIGAYSGSQLSLSHSPRRTTSTRANSAKAATTRTPTTATALGSASAGCSWAAR